MESIKAVNSAVEQGLYLTKRNQLMIFAKVGGKVLEKLTKEQEKGILDWQQHCLKIGRDTSPINKKLVEQSWGKFYKILNKEKPLFWYCQSPLQAQIETFRESIEFKNVWFAYEGENW